MHIHIHGYRQPYMLQVPTAYDRMHQNCSADKTPPRTRSVHAFFWPTLVACDLMLMQGGVRGCAWALLLCVCRARHLCAPCQYSTTSAQYEMHGMWQFTGIQFQILHLCVMFFTAHFYTVRCETQGSQQGLWGGQPF